MVIGNVDYRLSSERNSCCGATAGQNLAEAVSRSLRVEPVWIGADLVVVVGNVNVDDNVGSFEERVKACG